MGIRSDLDTRIASLTRGAVMATIQRRSMSLRTTYATLILTCMAARLWAGESVPSAGSEAFSAQAADAIDERIEPEKLRADFRIAREALEEGHGGIYRYTSKQELDRRFDQAEKSLTKPMSMLEFYRVLAPVVAAIKCGHTEVSLPKVNTKSDTAKNRILPLQVRVLEGKVYVWRDFSGATASLAGMEIRSINGVSASELVENMVAAASGDGDIQTSRMGRISGWAFSSQLSVLAGLAGPYDVTLWDPREKRELKVHLDGADMAQLKETARAGFPRISAPRRRGSSGTWTME